MDHMMDPSGTPSSMPAPPGELGIQKPDNQLHEQRREWQRPQEQKQPENPNNGSNDGNGNEREDAAEAAQPKPEGGFFTRLGLDAPTLILMFKGSLPPVIAIAIYQITPVATYFTNLGYLMAIVSVLSLAVLPRGKFIQTLALNILSVGVGAAILMLVLWSSLQARINMSPPQASPSPTPDAPPAYNSSQSAVCAVWLFFNVWFINVLRAKLPAFNIPVVIYSILVNVGATQGPMITTMAAAEALVRELLTVMLCGMGLAAGVSLLVIPISGRTVAFAQFKGAIGLMRAAVSAQRQYLAGLEEGDMFAASVTMDEAADEEHKGEKKGRRAKKAGETIESRNAEDLKDIIAKLRETGGRIHADISFAKRDIAWGKLDATDLNELYSLLRNIFIPLVGMSTIVDIFSRAAQRRGWDTDEDTPPEIIAEKNREKHIWNEIMRMMHDPFASLVEAIDQGLEHAGLVLELLPKPRQKTKETNTAEDSGSAELDVEAQIDNDLHPGDPGFASFVDEKVQAFSSLKGEILRTWAKQRGLASDEEHHLRPLSRVTTETRQRNQAQLYVLLYMEQLMLATGQAVQELAAFADKNVEDGTMKHSRLIFPSQRRLRKWFLSIFRDEDSTGDHAPDVLEARLNIVYMGDGYNRKKDPEHLPATNAWQHFGNGLRKAFRLLGSEESMFGLRVACATMTVGIVAYLQQTQMFFIEQRLVWAMIITAIGMTPTSGQSMFGFFLRIGGTLIAMINAYIIWYIVDQRTPGVIIFLWAFIFLEYYFLIKFPRFVPATMIAIVTQVLIIGYELQVLKIGQATAARTGQKYYPTYELAPYRLATVAGGSLVAFIWTIFPKTMTDRTLLRRDLSGALYLLANYFSVITETMNARLHDTDGDMDEPSSPAHHLFKARSKIFGKLMLLLPSMKSHAEWQKWEPSVGGRFPREVYEDIIERSTRIMNYLTLMSYTLTWHPHMRNETRKAASDNIWLHAFAEVLANISPTQHAIVSTLTLLSNSLLSGQSLPPFLPLPKPYEMTRQLLRLSNEHGPPAQGAAAAAEGDPLLNPGDKTESVADSGFVGPGIDTRTKPSVTTDKNVAQQQDSRPLLAQGPAAMRTGNILDARNMEQRGYIEFAVLQVCGTLVCDDLEGLVRAVGSLVGIVDFSLRVDVASDSSFRTGSDSGGSGARVERRQSEPGRRSGSVREGTDDGPGRGKAKGKVD